MNFNEKLKLVNELNEFLNNSFISGVCKVRSKTRINSFSIWEPDMFQIGKSIVVKIIDPINETKDDLSNFVQLITEFLTASKSRQFLVCGIEYIYIRYDDDMTMLKLKAFAH